MEQYPDLGSLFKCTAPVNLTNGDDDHFHVECVKNVYSRHIEFRVNLIEFRLISNFILYHFI